MAERKVKSLRIRQTAAQLSIQAIETFAKSYNKETQSADATVRRNSLNEQYKKFMEIQEELLPLDEENAEENLSIRQIVEEAYYNAAGKLGSDVSKDEKGSCVPASNIKLPDVKLPVFDGKPQNWLSFHSIFVAMIDSPKQYSGVQKFYYLRTSLSGPALQLIQSVPISEENYAVAWKLLLNHYNHPKRLKQLHVEALFEDAALKKEGASELRTLVEKFEANVNALTQLGEPTKKWDTLLIQMLSRQLDPSTLRSWREYSSEKEVDSYNDLVEFLYRRVGVLEVLPSSSSSVGKASKQRVFTTTTIQNNNNKGCAYCDRDHPVYVCDEFRKLSLTAKQRFTTEHKLCYNCLRPGHQLRECKSTSACKSCRKRHHTLLCPVPQTTPTVSPSTNEHQDPPTSTASASVVESITCASSGQQKTVLLATATVMLVDDEGRKHNARVLLDSGSESCFITEHLAQQMKSSREKSNLIISGISSTNTTAKQSIRATLRSRVGRYFANLQFFILPKVTGNLPSSSIDTSGWTLPDNIFLADPHFDCIGRIDVLLGAEVFFDIMKPAGRILLGKDQPVLVNSELGWIVSGPAVSTHLKASQPSSITVNHASTTVEDVHNLMERFWAIEEGETVSMQSKEQAACEEHFRRTVSRDSFGRYVVRLPLKEHLLPKLVDNRKTAVRRFQFLQARFNTNDELRNNYSSFIDEYAELGHMKRMTEEEYSNTSQHHYYMPHHAVMRDDSLTTKLRVVFDASSKTSSGVSLNDVLMVGPTIQDDIRSIIMRARKHPIMVVADIKMMYRQVLVDDRDTSLQLIVWKPTPSEPLQTYKLCTVTYGTASAPFLATRVLSQLADDEGNNYPIAARVLKHDFYVDDLVTGTPTADEANTLIHQLTALVSKGGFTLRKWATNNEQVREMISADELAKEESFCFDRNQIIKTLGLHWHPLNDTLTYCIKSLPERLITKRTTLSGIARLFDPIGLVGPLLTKAKIFMQSLWTLKADDGSIWNWDTELTQQHQKQWLSFQNDLTILNTLQIQRCVILNEATSVQLHIFADASQAAYGACAYLRSTNKEGTTKIALIAARSRVAPLKSQSIPRLELCSALIASELYQSVKQALQLDAESYFWLDSTVALYWLQAPPSKWNVFVGNRVAKIQETTTSCTWSHINGKENPADHISRGLTAHELVSCDLWWNGPPWLQQDQVQWPKPQLSSQLPPEVSIEERLMSVAVPTTKEETHHLFINEIISNISDYRKLLRVIAYCLRFKSKHHAPEEVAVISADELWNAEIRIIRQVQREMFRKEWSQLNQNQPVSNSSRLKWFHPFLCADKLIRIGGRLSKSNEPYDVKHQILLSSGHLLAALLMRYTHEKHCHAAPQLLLNILRQKYWIIGARSLAKRICHECVTCFRARPRQVEQFMAELPRSRITPNRPFSIVGVDYWGPINLSPVHRRAAPGKGFVAVFICFTTKAIHLELVTNLTTAKFIQALRRFVARRGLCSDIHSDNGRNFLGASRELRALVTSKQHRVGVIQECASEGIRWHFNPPKASHFGGLWESAIHSAQKHFFRVLGKTTLPQDDMETLLCQIECCLNSRPLVPLSDDPSDLESLTPGHFLVGSNLKAVPDQNIQDVPSNRLKHYELVQKFLQQTWNRWSAEYLTTLQPRGKWLKPPVKINVGQLVLIKDEFTAPMQWPLGRIVKLHPGDDGVVRVATVKTASGEYTRPVVKLCLLPVPVDVQTAV